MRKLVAAALTVLVAGCASKGIVSTEDMVVVQALTESKATRFAAKECARFNRIPVLTETSLRTYVFDCRVEEVQAPPRVPSIPETVMVEPVTMERPPAPSPEKITPMKVTPPPPPPKAAPTPPPAPAAKPAPAQQQAARPARREPMSPAIAGKRGWWVQVSADRSRKEAESAGRRVIRKFAKLLNKRKYRVEKVTVRDAGVYYRSRFGPYSSRAGAARACRVMKSQRQNCIVAR